MSRSRADENLSKLINELRQFVPSLITPQIRDDLRGGMNLPTMGEIDITQEVIEEKFEAKGEEKNGNKGFINKIITQKNSVPVVLLTPIKPKLSKSLKNYSFVEGISFYRHGYWKKTTGDNSRGIKLLRERTLEENNKDIDLKENLSSNTQASHIQSILAHGNFGSITLYADYTLKEFILQNDLDFIQLKELFAQIILALERYQHLGLLHRDIKPENILIMHEGDIFYVYFADFGSTADEKEKALASFNTPNYMDPQFKGDAYKKSNSHQKRAIDCYALGITLFNVMDFIKLTKVINDFDELIEGLRHKNYEDRFTIEQAKQNICFGKDKNERNNFFNMVKNKYARHDTYYDGYLQSKFDVFPEENTTFFILPRVLKKIYELAQDLQDISIILEDELNRQDEKSHDKEKYCYEIACHKRNKAYQLSILIQSYLNNKNRDKKSDIIAKKFAHIVGYMIREVDNSPMGEVILQECTVEKFGGILKNALKKYLEINNLLCTPSQTFFAKIREKLRLHNINGKHNAENFIDNIKNVSTPHEMFKRICEHLSDGKGNWNQHSFKTILAQELNCISSKPLDQWLYYLSTSPSSIKKLKQ